MQCWILLTLTKHSTIYWCSVVWFLKGFIDIELYSFHQNLSSHTTKFTRHLAHHRCHFPWSCFSSLRGLYFFLSFPLPFLFPPCHHSPLLLGSVMINPSPSPTPLISNQHSEVCMFGDMLYQRIAYLVCMSHWHLLERDGWDLAFTDYRFAQCWSLMMSSWKIL